MSEERINSIIPQDIVQLMGKYLTTLELWVYKSYPMNADEIYKRLRSSTLYVVRGFCKEGRYDDIGRDLKDKEQKLMSEFLNIDRDALFL